MKPVGRHPYKALTAATVRHASKPGRYADGGCLYLVVDKSGNKHWLLRVTVRGKRCDIGLGGWPTISLADAREEAASMLRTARKGGDPLAERRKSQRRPPSFRDAAKRVHAEHAVAWKNQKHAAQWISTLESYVFPHFGDMPVDQITTAEVINALSPIWLTKSETARRVRQRIGTVLDWAKAKGYRHDENPIRSVLKALPKQPKSEHHHASLPYDQLPGFLKELRKTDIVSSTRLAFEFMILTATRTNEVLHARWHEIDMERREWIIPAKRMKASREFRVPLSSPVVDILRQTRALNNGKGYVFEGKTAGKPLSQMVFLMTLRRMKKPVTAHGFRSTFRDWAAERTNVPREICEAALAHTVSDKTEAAYLRTDQFDKRRKLMSSWAKFAAGRNNAKVLKLQTQEARKTTAVRSEIDADREAL